MRFGVRLGQPRPFGKRCRVKLLSGQGTDPSFLPRPNLSFFAARTKPLTLALGATWGQAQEQSLSSSSRIHRILECPELEGTLRSTDPTLIPAQNIPAIPPCAVPIPWGACLVPTTLWGRTFSHCKVWSFPPDQVLIAVKFLSWHYHH